MGQVSETGINFIASFEISDAETYNKLYKTPDCPDWQDSDSGCTIGIGVDLSTNTIPEFYLGWADYLSGDILKRFEPFCIQLNGKSLIGKDCHDKLSTIQDIEIPYDMAISQFSTKEVVKFYDLSCKTYPGLENSPQCVIDAVVSLVYNRGSKLTGSTRVEMANIKDSISNKDWENVADQIDAMQKYWNGENGRPNIEGLVIRRKEEAEYIRNGLK